jgi:hypothetical protein
VTGLVRALFSGGFADDLTAVTATDPGVQLVDLDRLYAANRT